MSTSNTFQIITVHLNANHEIKTVNKIKKRAATDGQTVHNDVVQHFVTFRVNKEELAALPTATQNFTTVFSAMQRFNRAKPNNESSSDLTLDSHDNSRGWDLLLHIFSCDEIEYRFLKVPSNDLWHLAVVLDKWNVDHKHERVRGFYAAWYKEAAKMHETADTKEKIKFMTTLLWPSWYYDHADSFTASTKYLMYHDTGRVEPHNPTKYDGIRMPQRIIREYYHSSTELSVLTYFTSDMLNAGKMRIRHELLTKLYRIIQPELKASHCDHVPDIIFGFMLKLQDIEASFLNLGDHHVNANTLLDCLENFNFTPKVTCSRCSKLRHIEALVKNVCIEVRNYIDGLCLDDINKENRSKHNAKGCPYGDYEHRSMCEPVCWDAGCRKKHGQPTWYYSSTASEFHNRLFQFHEEASEEEED